MHVVYIFKLLSLDQFNIHTAYDDIHIKYYLNMIIHTTQSSLCHTFLIVYFLTQYQNFSATSQQSCSSQPLAFCVLQPKLHLKNHTTVFFKKTMLIYIYIYPLNTQTRLGPMYTTQYHRSSSTR